MQIFLEYYSRDNTIARADARLKILVGLVLLAMVISCKGFTFPLLVSFICLFLCVKMKVPLKTFLLRFSEPFFIMSVVLILKCFFSGKDVLFSIDLMGLMISGHRDGLMEGLIIAGRLLGAVSLVAVLGFSISFSELLAGLSWLRVPSGFVEVLMFAYRYIFVFFEDAMIIYNAQKNRLGYSNVRVGLGSFGVLAGSLILKSFEHSHKITVSMIQRGYGGDIAVFKHKPFEPAEVLFSVSVLTAMGIIWKMQ